VTADYILQSILARQAWRILPLEFDHFGSLNLIESFTDHTDPFDRMLIAQAKSEGLNVMTADEQFSRYKINVVW
jgi:PIN domain nuclease of toxin-antitoxin system